MKKLLSFLRSMRFGMGLLVLIMLCSFAGSLIPQQREAVEYTARYGEAGAHILLFLGLDDVFSRPYFVFLMAALCVNLVFCSLVRLPRTRSAGEALRTQAKRTPIQRQLSAKQVEALRIDLRAHRFKVHGEVYARVMLGFYGSFLTHLSLLLVLIVGSGAIFLANVTDVTVMPGQPLVLADGVTLTVESFHIEDETGRLDYASRLRMTSADGQESKEGIIRVNEPMRFGAYKVYQQTYGTAGSVRIKNLQNGAQEEMTLTQPCFLTLDGISGMFYQALYPGYVQHEDGSITLITSTAGAYDDPVYDVLSMSGGVSTPVLAFPGETLTIGEISYTLLDPVSYPGLRIKHVPSAVLGAMYGVFALMIAALYLCFFVTPVCVRVTEEGYALCSPKTAMGLSLEIEALLERENKS